MLYCNIKTQNVIILKVLHILRNHFPDKREIKSRKHVRTKKNIEIIERSSKLKVLLNTDKIRESTYQIYIKRESEA